MRRTLETVGLLLFKFLNSQRATFGQDDERNRVERITNVSNRFLRRSFVYGAATQVTVTQNCGRAKNTVARARFIFNKRKKKRKNKVARLRKIWSSKTTPQTTTRINRVWSERAKLWLPPCSTIGRQILTTEMIFSSLLTANCRPSATPKMTDFIGTDTFIFNFVNILCSP